MKKLVTGLISLGLVIAIGVTLIAGIFGAVSGSRSSDCDTSVDGGSKTSVLGETLGVSATDWQLVLVNRENKKSDSDFSSISLVSAGGQQVDSRIKDSVEAFLKEANSKRSGYSVVSGYRDTATQSASYENWINIELGRGSNTREEAIAKVHNYLQPPGASEHMTGLAIDITNKGSLNEMDSASIKILEEVGEKHGFIRRFKAKYKSTTGVDEEDWHFRYVGKEVAKYINDNDISLEEFHERLKETKSDSNSSSSAGNDQSQFLSDEEKEEVAWQTYSVLMEWGLPQNKSIGAVANGDTESGLNPAKVESDYMSSWQKFAVGSDDYWNAIRKNGGPTVELLFNQPWSYVAPRMGAGDESGYIGSDPNGHHWLGFSLFQRTGYAGVKPYFDWAEEKGYDPVATDTVLLGVVSDLSEWYKKYTPQGDYYYKRVVRVRDDVLDGKDASTPAEGAEVWLRFYEYEAGWNLGINSVMNLPHRQEVATKWAVILGKKGVDKSYAKSILSKANISSSKKAAEANKSTDKCGKKKKSSGKVNATGHPYDVDYRLSGTWRRYQGGGVHNGVDLTSTQPGSPIINLLDGVVVKAGQIPEPNPGSWCPVGYNGTPTAVVVKSENVGDYGTVYVQYWHMQNNSHMVEVGDKVVAGQELGLEGETGCASGVHLHLQANIVDPYGADYGKSSIPDVGNVDPAQFIEGLKEGDFDVDSSSRLSDGYLIKVK